MQHPETIVRESTRIQQPRLIPEVRLHLADEDLPLYRKGEVELAAMGIDMPFWAFAWAGGQALARYILDKPEVVRGRKVLDFGAGSGLVAIAAAKAGAFDAVACDIDPLAGEAIRMNAELNDVHIEFLNDDPIGRIERDWEIVLVGDVFYDKEIADKALPWLRDLVAAKRTVLIGDPGRFYLPNLGMERIASYHAPTTSIMEDSDLRNAGVWHFLD